VRPRKVVAPNFASVRRQTTRVAAALDAIVGAGFGTLVSCVPGRLGYFEGEGQGKRYLLER